ncbi:hypothetical protein EIB18_03480 [Caulobacter vibrioides]|nr:hypothetical protein CA608_03270 [Caulobacter vibrioides]AZH11866.1 hypothetical protein EIB18_03480 [Caulobacter vibrioides]PLR11787.1 hypothetical protein CVUC_10310 [Caulobacter vibrioides]
MGGWRLEPDTLWPEDTSGGRLSGVNPMRILTASTVICALLVAAPALAAEPKAARACFDASDINGFNVIDDRTVDVSISPRQVYRLTLFAPSRDIDSALQLGVEARGGSWICTGLDATIIVPGDRTGMGRYPVTEVRKLTTEEIQAKRKR